MKNLIPSSTHKKDVHTLYPSHKEGSSYEQTSCKMKEVETLTEQINKKDWWHSPPVEKDAYKKRGIFLASSYKECEFYGRPLANPIKVCLSNPLIDTEQKIIELFFGKNSSQMKAYESLLNNTSKDFFKTRFKLDSDIYKAAKKKGYDAVAVVTEQGVEKIKEGKLPKSVELNILDTKNITRGLGNNKQKEII